MKLNDKVIVIGFLLLSALSSLGQEKDLNSVQDPAGIKER